MFVEKRGGYCARLRHVTVEERRIVHGQLKVVDDAEGVSLGLGQGHDRNRKGSQGRHWCPLYFILIWFLGALHKVNRIMGGRGFYQRMIRDTLSDLISMESASKQRLSR
jgi:hypothetical protein